MDKHDGKRVIKDSKKFLTPTFTLIPSEQYSKKYLIGKHQAMMGT